MDPSSPGARERFEALFVAHYRDVHRYALRRTAPADAEEVANETFLICWRRLRAVPDPALPWLYATAGKVLANQRRSDARHRARGEAAAEAERLQAKGRDPAERFVQRDEALRAFSSLGERDREALRLVAWEGLSIADAARAARVPRATFAMRLHRARRRLADQLEPSLPSLPDLENAR